METERAVGIGLGDHQQTPAVEPESKKSHIPFSAYPTTDWISHEYYSFGRPCSWYYYHFTIWLQHHVLKLLSSPD